MPSVQNPLEGIYYYKHFTMVEKSQIKLAQRTRPYTKPKLASKCPPNSLRSGIFLYEYLPTLNLPLDLKTRT